MFFRRLLESIEMSLRVYNTLTKEKEVFEPLEPGVVRMYVCGPTVYGHPHLGHAKSYISFDVIYRYLMYKGYQVRYVQNITDVGHLTEDTEGMADEGEDKIAKEAARVKQHPMQIVEMYTKSYFDDMDMLNVLRPDISPRATGHIPEQIEMAKQLIAKGHAYESNGSVYFDVASFKEYGKLSRRNVEEMEAGARVGVHSDKRHPADFALWKKADADHVMQWNSPWGRGYPGWHLECSAMSMKYLGDAFDIHGGGLENQFPHHECEIAQSEAITGKAFVKYWLHNNMVTVDGKKMGKSMGNFITMKQLFNGDHERLDKAYHPLAVRQFVLSSHYRSNLDFSNEALAAAESGFHKLKESVLTAAERAKGAAEEAAVSETVTKVLTSVRERFDEAMDDDFNTAVGLSVLFGLGKEVQGWAQGGDLRPADWAAVEATFRRLGGDVLGVVPVAYAEEGGGGGHAEAMDAVMKMVIELRAAARKEKNFAIADKIRDDLTAAGVQLEDGADGTVWRIQK
jgi:cysteinyl-tRNA synthetase